MWEKMWDVRRCQIWRSFICRPNSFWRALRSDALGKIYVFCYSLCYMVENFRYFFDIMSNIMLDISFDLCSFNIYIYIISGIYSEIISDISSNIFSDISSDVTCTYMKYLLVFVDFIFDIHYQTLSDISINISSNTVYLLMIYILCLAMSLDIF